MPSVKKAKFTSEAAQVAHQDVDEPELPPHFEEDDPELQPHTATVAPMDIDEVMPAAIDAPSTSSTTSGAFKEPIINNFDLW